MSPELAFLLTLALRMAITAAFVVSASVITERSGPVIGALVATLPISAGPSYVFLALDHDAAFIAEGALASLPINAATIFLGLTYVVLAQRQNALVSCLGAVAVWIALASIIRSVQWTLAGGLIVNAIAFAICVPLLRRFRHVKMPLITRRWYDIPLRAALVATLVATVVTASGWVGPKVSGIIALFPIVFTSMMLILHPRIGGPPTAAVIANSAGGLMGLGIAIAMINVAALRFGSAIGLEPRAGDLRRAGISGCGGGAGGSWCSSPSFRAVEDANPESRDSGFDASHRPGMTIRVRLQPCRRLIVTDAGRPARLAAEQDWGARWRDCTRSNTTSTTAPAAACCTPMPARCSAATRHSPISAATRMSAAKSSPGSGPGATARRRTTGRWSVPTRSPSACAAGRRASAIASRVTWWRTPARCFALS